MYIAVFGGFGCGHAVVWVWCYTYIGGVWCGFSVVLNLADLAGGSAVAGVLGFGGVFGGLLNQTGKHR